MSTIIFDFDHTLFDTKKFKSELDGVLLNNRIPKNIIEQSELEFRKNNFNNYDFEEHLNLIEQAFGSIDKDLIYNQVVALDFKKNLKGDVARSMTSLKNHGHRLILLTKGTANFQSFKIHHSGIKDLFDEVIILSHSKEGAVKSIKRDEEKLYFFNDDVKEMQKIKSIFPKESYIICKRSDDKFDYATLDQDFHLIHNIDELEQCIKKIRPSTRDSRR